LSDDYLENGNLQQALKRLMQDGVPSEDGRRAMGLREMMERMRMTRSEQLNRYNMASGVMDDLRQKLEEIKHLEREGIQHRLEEKPESQQPQAANSPQSGQQSQQGQQGQQPQARQQGQQGQRSEAGSQQQQMMQQFFQGMQQSLQNMTSEDIAKLREMIRDLNKMLRERQEGREPDFDSFMQKHGEYFPGVNSLDDLIEQIRQQQAAMQGILDNLSPEQRRELQQLMDQVMGDDRIRVDMMELAQNLEAVAPWEETRTR